ncbi:MAG: sialate O-acetylesterase [Algibacter sp.]
MKKKYSLSQIIFLISFLFFQTLVIAQRDVYLVIGERNAQGRATIEAEDEIALTDVGLYDGSAWEDAKNDSSLAPDGGLNRHSSINKTTNDQGLNFAYAFGKMVNEVTGNEIGLVVNARAGADIEDWLDGAGTNYYEDTVTQLNAALTLEAGSILKGILWCHGEADRNDSGYLADLNTLVASFRAEYGIADLPFIACEISKQRTDNETFNTAIKTISDSGDAAYIPDTAYVSSDGLQTISGNVNDYNSNSQRVLGYRYAAKVLEMVYGYTYVENHIMYVTEDAFLRGGTNSGTAQEPIDDQRIRLKYTTSSPNNERIGLLKFDVSTLTGTADRIVVDATLKVNPITIDGYIDVSFYDMDTSWSESTVTLDYINANGGFSTPISKSTAVFDQNLVDTALIHNGADLTEFIKDEYGFGTSTLSLGIQSDTDGGNDFMFTPKDHSTDSALKPYIVVSYLEEPVVSTPQTTKLAKLTFETDPTDTDPAITDISYTTSIVEYSDIGVGDAEDFFIRTKDGDQTGSDVDAVYSYIDPVDLGDYFFIASDIDDGGTYTVPVYLDLEEMDISNYENLEFRVYLASIGGEDNGSGAAAAWDNNPSGAGNNNDYVHFTYDVDNTGGYTNLLWIESQAADGIINEEPKIDTNFDGRGDGASIVDTFTQFTASIPTTGNTLDIQIEFKFDNHGEDLAIDNIEIWGTLITPCGGDVTWNGSSWDNTVGPNISTPAIINGSYTVGASTDSFSSCSLTINGDVTVEAGYYIEVEHDVTVNGSLTIENKAAFVQNHDNGSFTNSGTGVSTVKKTTNILNAWYYYTYWSSPVSGLTIATSPLAGATMRYWYNADNYLDEYTEINNTDTFEVIAASDDIDDDGDDWQYATDATDLTPGIGFAATRSEATYSGAMTYDYDFVGEFNNGVYTAPIYHDPLNTGAHWNLIGNPYPCALDFDAFVTNNPGVVAGAAYLWSHTTAPLATASGNQDLNFSSNDYVIINTGSGSINNTPNTLLEYIPSSQGFLIPGLADGSVTFNNSMRIKNPDSNSQFFKNTNKKSTTEANKLWINLTSDFGLFNQVLIAYVDGATNNYDGMTYDTPRILSSGVTSTIYTLIDDKPDKKYAIQGKSSSSINEDEVIPLGFYSSIDIQTSYSISIDHLQGDFLTENTIYLKDNLLSTVHNLSDSDYHFTSYAEDYNTRFEITFKTITLSIDDDTNLTNNALQVIYLGNQQITFKISNNLTIKQVTIYDLLGRKLNDFEGESNSETYSLSYLSNATYIAKIKLSNGKIITKKIIKH